MDPTLASKLARKREQYKAKLATALTEDADPLAAYHSFVKWTIDSYGTHLANSGLLELLEEATRYFVDDDAYKSDLRYLKLWLLYASHVEDPTVIFGFVLSKDIGKIYAQTYQEFADALEGSGRRAEAEAVYKQGLKCRARPVDPLKRKYEEFKSRTSASPPNYPTAIITWQDAPFATRALRHAPLKNHASLAGPSSTSAVPREPYALMLAPPVPGKRKEKLRFDLSLLFTADGTEYSMQEARARSMGLLGKKWGPPPMPEPERRVTFSGDSTNARKKSMARKFAAGNEPTVTLATKEALADVFGMYNSPEKTMRFGPAAGSKHAPVRKIEAVTPVTFQPLLRSLSSENAEAPSKTSTFRPFVDENAGRGNKTLAPPKIDPFVDPDLTPKAVVPPSLNRSALSVKDAATPSTNENGSHPRKKLVVHIDSEEAKSPSVFSLTPASATSRDRPRDVAAEETRGTGESASRPIPTGATKSVAFGDENAPKVFSMPFCKNENVPTPTFTPFVDKTRQAIPSSALGRSILGERTPLHPVFTPRRLEPEQAESKQKDDPEPESESEPATPTTDSDVDEHLQYELHPTDSQDAFTSESSEDVDDFDVSYQEANEAVPIEGAEDSIYDDDSDHDVDVEGDQTDGYRPPLGGRFGEFNVMTPITERTFEYTMSTRGTGTPGIGTPGFSVHRDAVEAAEQLVAELQVEEEEEEEEEEDDDDEDDDDDVVNIEERTGTLSLADALDVASSFRPPNPCNPFNPQITSTLLRLIPLDAAFHDLRNNDVDQLETLQKFAKRKTRRTSGNSSSGKSMPGAETFEIRVHDRRFAVVDKLGEGGFGTVFEAIDLDLTSKDKAGDDDDDDDHEDDDAEEANRVALKVVKPRNLWEFHVLRRIHTTLPASLRQSIIAPQALYAFRDESFMVLELRKQGTLLDIVNRAPSVGITQQGACLDELLVMFFTIELMRLLEGMHSAGFIHGDMKIDNCLLRLEDVPGSASAWDSVYRASGEGGWSYKGIKLIDFGRTIDTRLFAAGQRYVADWPTDARDCLEMREGRPWTFQTDYFGLAGIIYCMLYGKYIEASSVAPAPAPAADGKVHFKLSTPFKRYWQGDLWTRLFDVLLNPTAVRPDGKLPVTNELASLRTEMETWLQANCNRASNSLKGLLKKVGLAILGGKDGSR